MAGRHKRIEKDIDPEVLARLKFLRKCRFRAIGRMVMANTYWLTEATDEYEGVEDVKRRVAQAVRRKTKKKRLLSITDKALLNKPAEDRTESEKKYIYRIIGGLKCFKRYPNGIMSEACPSRSLLAQRTTILTEIHSSAVHDRASPANDSHRCVPVVGVNFCECGEAGRHTSRSANPEGTRRTQCRIGTWKVRGGLNDMMDEVIDIMNKRRLDALSLTEIKRKGCDVDDLPGGMLALWSGVDRAERASGTLGFVLSSRFVSRIKVYCLVNPRLLCVRLKLGITRFFLVAAYALVSSADPQELEKFWESVREILDLAEGNERIIICACKKKLAAVTYFKYYGPGRVIVRQDQEAHGMYFIVTGDVIISHMVYDELLKQHISVDLGVMHAGDMFGEVSLLHNIPRTATCTTAGHCELLLLMKADFKTVLQASVQKQWDEVRDAMSAFSYFDALDEVARREGCIVAKMKTYSKNETMYGDGVGVFNFVYFILSGRCQMIESLQVIPKHHLGRTTYTLYDPYIPEVESEQDFDAKYFSNYKGKEKNVSSVTGPKDTEISKISVKPNISAAKTSETKNIDSSVIKVQSVIKNPICKRESVERAISNETRRAMSRHSGTRVGFQNSNKKVLEITQEDQENEDKETNDATHLEKDILQPKTQSEFVRFSIDMNEGQLVPLSVKTYFMQVCQFNPGSTFGFGENMRDRRIVALTPVECMLLPKMWLLQRNTANIWSRIQHYLEKNIPNKRQLFKEFVAERRWQDYRDGLVQDVVARSNTVNWTTVHDVPYSIRMEEMLNI